MLGTSGSLACHMLSSRATFTSSPGPPGGTADTRALQGGRSAVESQGGAQGVRWGVWRGWPKCAQRDRPALPFDAKGEA